ncbi:uncharacterized protein LOC110728684 [Chenopodium quinoa]|uniref:uncharacterized protein LOC110728684 n=1 Tax=Chenopodium quinoa TaxID=63459 RepID=UPI000B7737FD|nr:uncharacterized protein LOC110728684 [Chenopodium quinoa]
MHHVDWTAWVWNSFNFPKHSFITWIAVQDRLRTRKKLMSLGICQDASCLLCGESDEDTDHLFFNCSFSKTCIRLMSQWLDIPVSSQNIQEAWKWWRKSIKDQIKRKVVLAVLAAVVYHIWLARNHAYLKKAVIHPRILCNATRIEIVDRLKGLIYLSWIREHCKWLDHLNYRMIG